MITSTLDIEHRFYYDTDAPVTAKMLAESLVGLDGAVKASVEVLEMLLDAQIKDSSVLIRSIQLGSYDENIIVRFLFGKGKAGERNIEKLRKQLGLKNMDAKKIATIALLAVIAYGAWRFASSGGHEQATIHIENSFNNWGKDIGMTKEELIAVVEAAIRNKQDLKRQVVRLTHPDGNEASGTITIDGNTSYSIPSEVIKAIPADWVKDQPAEPEKDFDDTLIVIRAADLDRPAVGWAGIAPDISDKRLPVQLDDGVDALKIPLGKYTRANITVIYKVDRQGTKTPKKYLLRKLTETPVSVSTR